MRIRFSQRASLRSRVRVISLPSWFVALPLVISPAMAQVPSLEAEQAAFSTCKPGLLQAALDAGVAPAVAEPAVQDLAFQPRVIELDRSQPEFTQSFAHYFSVRVSQQRIGKGAELLAEHRQLLSVLEQQYGVPGRYIVAFWGLETNFGGYLGTMPTLDSLATLACDPRRSEYFTDELVHALKIVEEQGVEPNQMRGSWAGAMGHTQFMPSNYRRYAVDGDGDGRIDLWSSTTDALTSAAAFLHQLGWQRGQRWGREVRLPAGFDYTLVDPNVEQSIQQWSALGVRDAWGNPLPQANFEARVVLPSGHAGPAFLVYENFDVIMKWNRSESYALSVGHLADRVGGAGGLVVSPPQHEPWSRDFIARLQARLTQLGFDAGGADGVMGSRTRAAIRAFQASRGLVADAYPSAETLTSLGMQP